MRLTLEEKKKKEGPPSAPEAAVLFLATLVGEFIRWWRQDFFLYCRGAYEMVDTGYIAWLAREYVVDTWGVAEADHEYVKAIVETIKQARYIDSRWEQPFNLDGTPVGSCLVMDNGVLHFDKMLDGGQPELLPHTPNLFSLGRGRYSYDPAAKAPLYEAFLDTMAKGCQRTRQLLLEMIFYTLELRLQYQSFFWQIGGGANGKSVYLHVLRHLLGTNSISAIPLSKLGTKFQNAALLGKRANIACDVAAEVRKDHLSRIRLLADGSPVDTERKWRDPMCSIISARMFFASNDLPHIGDRSNGTWRRMILIVCDAEIERQIPQYEKWLLPELSGVLNLALQAGPDLIDRGHFDVPERCQLAKEKYKLELDTSRSFCRECLVFDKRAFIISDEIYSYYRVWCHAHGHTPVNSPNFWRSFHVEMQKQIADGTVEQKRPTLKERETSLGLEGAAVC